MLRQILVGPLPLIVATYMPFCTPAVQPAPATHQVPVSALWEEPVDLCSRDLLNGPWGPQLAPDPAAEYAFVRPKSRGVNPGVVLTDPRGREWHVKQAGDLHQGAEGPPEVVLSRVLSAIGYHQPPVYFLPSFKLRDQTHVRVVPGGRFR